MTPAGDRVSREESRDPPSGASLAQRGDVTTSRLRTPRPFSKADETLSRRLILEGRITCAELDRIRELLRRRSGVSLREILFVSGVLELEEMLEPGAVESSSEEGQTPAELAALPPVAQDLIDTTILLIPSA